MHPSCAQPYLTWCVFGDSSHLGKPSYAERGLAEVDYKVYWDMFVWPKWKEHGVLRAGSFDKSPLQLDALVLPSDQVAKVLATGWFSLRS
mmetsp:Transcript_46566/g.106825  ORF Transcript_46566/g.106825 Transcript_46566/m.106825 type:complete len:90 (+) Transcript_46566:44-313(+)